MTDPSMIDPIVEEARRAGQAYIDKFNGDLKAVFADLRRRTEAAAKAGHKVAAPPPLPKRLHSKTKKQAG